MSMLLCGAGGAGVPPSAEVGSATGTLPSLADNNRYCSTSFSTTGATKTITSADLWVAAIVGTTTLKITRQSDEVIMGTGQVVNPGLGYANYVFTPFSLAAGGYWLDFDNGASGALLCSATGRALSGIINFFADSKSGSAFRPNGNMGTNMKQLVKLYGY